MQKSIIAAAAWLCSLAIPYAAVAATDETAKADASRRAPLQRCDQLAEKAQLECLQKARQRVVDARSKREASAEQKNAKARGERIGKPDNAENSTATSNPKSR